MLDTSVQSSASSDKTAPNVQPVYRNSVPVVVMLLPVRERGEGAPVGLLTVIRGIEPQKGKHALPGGFVEEEVWQEAAMRELREETGLKIASPSDVQLETIESVQNGRRLLIFSKLPEISIDAISEGFTSDETLALEVIFEAREMAFPTHTAAVKRFFDAQERGVDLGAAVFTR